MRKILVNCVMFFIMIHCVEVCAYSTGDYSITVPLTFEQQSEGNFIDNKGNSFNIQVSSSSELSSFSEDKLFTNDNLEEIVDGISEAFNDPAMFQSINEKNGLGLNDSQINEISGAIEVVNVTNKEITVVGTEKYKCFHYKINLKYGGDTGSLEQYMIPGVKKTYVLSLSCYGKEKISFEDRDTIINSLSITNYEGISNKSILSKFSDATIESFVKVVALVIFSGIVTLIGKLFNKLFGNQKNDDTKKINCKVCGKKIDYNENGTCEECHEKIMKRIKEKENKSNSDEENSNNTEGNETIITKKNDAKNEDPILLDSDESKGELVEHKDNIYCINCGKPVKREWKYCKYCGREIE